MSRKYSDRGTAEHYGCRFCVCGRKAGNTVTGEQQNFMGADFVYVVGRQGIE